MKIISLEHKNLFLSLSFQPNFLIKLEQLGQLWLFNCIEGCQQILAQKKIKVNQITKIIITDLYINNISGLLGLLSSLSLNSNIKCLDLYAPKGLINYLLMGRKYSLTSFRYKLYLHIISKGLITSCPYIKLYAYSSTPDTVINYCLLVNEKLGHFDLKRSLVYNIPLGPLFSKLKEGNNFLLPDGYIVYGNLFLDNYSLGNKIVVISPYSSRLCVEFIHNATYVIYSSVY